MSCQTGASPVCARISMQFRKFAFAIRRPTAGSVQKSSTMHCENRNRKWACKSRIGAYIRGEIKLEDIMHPSKIIKPKKRHNRRCCAFYDTDACRPIPLNNEKIVTHKDIESRIRPYIQGLKSLKDLVHPSKLTNCMISSKTFLELVQGDPQQNAIMYDGGDSKMMDNIQESQSVLREANFQSLFKILENTACSDAVIRVNDQLNQRYVTVLVSDKPYPEGEQMLSLIAKMQNGDVIESKLGMEVPPQSHLSCMTKYDSPIREATSDQPSPQHVVHSPLPSAASDTNQSDHSSKELVTQLYQKIQTLLEERVETLAYNQHQFEKLEMLQKDNFHLRSTIAKIGEKLNDIEDSADREPASYQEKLRAQNQRLLKTIDTMNSYLVNFESKSMDAETRRKDAAEIDGDRYKNLYEREVKNFKRHKRKCEAQQRQLLQRCNQLHHRLQELDDQNLEMAAKLSYVPVKIQLACRQYQDIIKKLNDDLHSLRNLERKTGTYLEDVPTMPNLRQLVPVREEYLNDALNLPVDVDPVILVSVAYFDLGNLRPVIIHLYEESRQRKLNSPNFIALQTSLALLVIQWNQNQSTQVQDIVRLMDLYSTSLPTPEDSHPPQNHEPLLIRKPSCDAPWDPKITSNHLRGKNRLVDIFDGNRSHQSPIDKKSNHLPKNMGRKKYFGISS